MQRVLLVAGARPNFMKLAPLWREMKRTPESFCPLIVHTGQHYDQKMSQVFFDELGLPTPDVYLGVGSGSHAQQTARIMMKFEKVLFEQNPDWVVVFGDVNSTIAASLVAAKEHYKVAHVEAGLRSGDWSMPEEINRVITDRLSDLLLTPSHDAGFNLIQENIDEHKIHFVGNIMIDTLKEFITRADRSTILQELDLKHRHYALVTLHRPANVDDRNKLTGLVDILTAVSRRLPLVFPIHPRTRNSLESAGLLDLLLRQPERLRLIEPVGYLDFLKLEKEAKVVLTDSGGIQEETTVLQVPCLTMRENTERPVTITEGTNTLVGTDKEKILAELDRALSDTATSHQLPQYWDGQTAKRICGVLKSSVAPDAVTWEHPEPAVSRS